MDMGFLGTMLAAGGQGFDYQQGLDRQKQMYEDQRTRQATADARATTTFNEGQESYQHGLTRRPVVEGQQDARADAENTGLGLRNALEQNTVARIPTKNQQDDQAFATEQALRRSQIAGSGQEQAMRALQMRKEQLGLDDSMLDHSVQQNQRALVSAFQGAAQSGDYGQFVETYNGTVGHTLGHNITGLKRNPDGSFTATQEGGEPMQFKDGNALLEGALSMNDPSLMVHSLYAQHQAAAAAAQERAKDPKKFGELVRDDDGTLGNVDLTTNKFVPLTDPQGNPLRGTLAGKTRAGVANDAAEAFYQQRVKAGDTPEDALSATKTYMAAFHPSAKGIWNRGPADGPQMYWPGEGDPSPPPRNSMSSALESASGSRMAPGARAAPPVKGAKQARDGNWYVPDPKRPGKWLMVSN